MTVSPVTITFVLCCSVAAVAIWLRPIRFYLFPGIMTAVFIGYILPQMIAVTQHRLIADSDEFLKLQIMAILCLAACWLGYQIPPATQLARLLPKRLNEDRLLIAGYCLWIVGITFWLLMRRAWTNPDYRTAEGTMTGIVTIYLFFSMMIYPAMAIAVTCLHRKPNTLTMALFGLTLIRPAMDIVLAGRRESAGLTILILMMGMLFQRGWVVPRVLLVLVVIAGAVLVPVISEYRALVSQRGIEGILEFSPVEVYQQKFDNLLAIEIIYACRVVRNTDQTGQYGYGAGYWNTLVFRLVPAQLVGKSVKDSLTIDSSKAEVSENDRNPFFVGVVMTGLADSYHEFSYFGALFFVGLAWFYRSLWHAAVTQRMISAQLVYMTTMIAAMRSLTHQTYDFLPGMIEQTAFLTVAFLLAALPDNGEP